MLTYTAALEIILGIPFSAAVETVPLKDCVGRVLADSPQAPFPNPRFDQSSMDGIAVLAADGAAPRTLVGESAAGRRFVGTLQPGTAIRISTGAPMHDGADTVVPIERVTISGNKVTMESAPEAGAFIRFRGEDVREGEPLLAPGMVLSPARAAFLASFNLPEVRVFARPTVAIFTSGDELRAVEEPLGEDEICASSLLYLEEELARCNTTPRVLGIARDSAESVRNMLAAAFACADIVVSTAGVSVGEHDHIGDALRSLGAEILFWRVAVRPGKPMLVAQFGDKVFFGLPGNPVSTCANTELFVKPFLRRAFGMQPIPEQELVRLAAPCPRDRSRLFFVYAVDELRDGARTSTPLDRQSSANLRNPAMADRMLVIGPGETPVNAGETVPSLVVRTGFNT